MFDGNLAKSLLNIRLTFGAARNTGAGGKTWTWDFWVISKGTSEVLLGNDFLVQHRAVVHYPANELRLHHPAKPPHEPASEVNIPFVMSPGSQPPQTTPQAPLEIASNTLHRDEQVIGCAQTQWLPPHSQVQTTAMVFQEVGKPLPPIWPVGTAIDIQPLRLSEMTEVGVVTKEQIREVESDGTFPLIMFNLSDEWVLWEKFSVAGVACPFTSEVEPVSRTELRNILRGGKPTRKPESGGRPGSSSSPLDDTKQPRPRSTGADASAQPGRNTKRHRYHHHSHMTGWR
jgi:hypothetical protein